MFVGGLYSFGLHIASVSRSIILVARASVTELVYLCSFYAKRIEFVSEGEALFRIGVCFSTNALTLTTCRMRYHLGHVY